MSGAYLQLDALSRYYGNAAAVKSLSLTVKQGEMVALLGPSGCGKTTVIRMIAGFVQPSNGDVRINGRSIIARPAHERSMGIVFQSYALFPHMTVAKNIAFGLEMKNRPRDEIDKTIDEMLKLTKLEGFGPRFPRQLSGGQQQRVALARALAPRPQLLLLDEPLSNLDASLRQEVARDIRLVQQASGLAAIMVTHDQDEAMAVADTLVVMREGEVQQIGSQKVLYEEPANSFVASFIGRANTMSGKLEDGRSLVTEDGAIFRLSAHYPAKGRCALALRPERMKVFPIEPVASHPPQASGKIELVTYLGYGIEYLVRMSTDCRVIVRTAIPAENNQGRAFRVGERVNLSWTESAERLFDDGDHPVSTDVDAELKMKSL